MKKVLRFVVILGIAGSSFGLCGCSADQFPSYPAGMKYGLRVDPIIRTLLSEDQPENPDRPGLYPLLKFEEIYNPELPNAPKIKKLLAPTLKKIIDAQPNAGSLTEQQWKELEDKILREPAKYRKELDDALDKAVRNPANMPEKDRAELEKTLDSIFGTPAGPLVDFKAMGVTDAEISDLKLSELKLDKDTLAKGSSRYRVHCVHCHGVPGDGRGPTARWINPHPRDFRQGKFKFQSVNQTEDEVRDSNGAIKSLKGVLGPPARADLLRTLRAGIEGTAMPSFNLLHDDDLESIVSYVIHLSMRGNVEFNVLSQSDNIALNEKGAFEWVNEDATPAEATKKSAKKVLENWARSQDPLRAIQVKPYLDPDFEELKKSAKRGKYLFLGSKVGDLRTAAPDVLAHFRKQFLNEDFEKAKSAAEAGKKKLDKADLDNLMAEVVKNAEEGMDKRLETKFKSASCVSCHADYGRQARFRFDEWGTLVRPNNFTVGIFRGGRRPIDMYYRIHSGINGSNMTPFGSVLQGQDIWDLVNFVTNLSYPAMRDRLKLDID